MLFELTVKNDDFSVSSVRGSFFIVLYSWLVYRKNYRLMTGAPVSLKLVKE